jgi:SAM-dependent methyltransferase
MPDIEADFDLLALFDDDGWTTNNHYHNFILRNVPENCLNTLEIGCGTGAFSRRLAEVSERVVALDLSPEMIRVAHSRSANFPNIDFQLIDVMEWDFPASYFDCICTIATLHHLPQREMLLKAKEALKPGGVVIVLDLVVSKGARDAFLDFIAIGVSVGLRLFHNGRFQPPPEVRAAWEEHGKTDSYATIDEIRKLCDEILPGAKVRRHLLWRYSLVYQKPFS